MPRFADVELEGTLCDLCRPGDIVTVLGVAEVMAVEAAGSALQRQRNATIYDIYIAAVSVVKRKGAGAEHAAQPLSAAAAAAFKRGLPNMVGRCRLNLCNPSCKRLELSA